MFTDHGEIQKYRKLTKNEKKERGRILFNKRTTKRMQYYKPSRELTRTQWIKRNIAQVVSKEKRREDTTRSETWLKKMKARILNASTSGNESNSSILKVRMNFNKRKNASRVRVSRALSKAHRQMNPLRVENVKLT